MNLRHYHFPWIPILLLTATLAGCNLPMLAPSESQPGPLQTYPATRTPFQPGAPSSAATAEISQVAPPVLPLVIQPATLEPAVPAVPEATAVPTTTGPGAGVWLAPYLPERLRATLLTNGVVAVPEAAQAAARIEAGSAGSASPVAHWLYALVTPFASTVQGVSLNELQGFWGGAGGGLFAGRPLLLDESTLGMFTAVWGAPADGAVQVLPAADLLLYAWEHRPTWAIVPFELVEARWKVLEVDGQSPLRKGFDVQAYPLALTFGMYESTPGAAAAAGLAALALPGNYDPNHLTTVAMTGVTALVRATAFTMERRGVNYPGKDIGDWLRAADVTHISNEVPFARNCPSPNPVQQGVRFCSDARYIELLENMGTDIIELTGDHFHDYGDEAMLYTLELYRQRGWPYYGGGENLAAGRQAVTIEHNGNRLAFIGCNGKGGSFAQASARRPGSAECDMDWMAAEISRLRTEGYLPIATFQHFEYYTYQAQPAQKKDFRKVAEAGAVVVSGSQAHQPQAFEFIGSSLIHYGLGNLFFDQYDISLPCRQAFIDRHVFYEGRYIGVELLPIMFVDYARPRPMTVQERNDLLQAVFSASGW